MGALIDVRYDDFFKREIRTYSKVFHIKLKNSEPVIKAKPIINYKDAMGWVNQTIFNAGEMYVTEEKIRWGKRQVYNYMLDEATKRLEAATKRFEFVKNVKM